MTPEQQAQHAVRALAAEYRRIAALIVSYAERLENTPLDVLARQPIPYVHSSTRDMEDAVDAALLAL